MVESSVVIMIYTRNIWEDLICSPRKGGRISCSKCNTYMSIGSVTCDLLTKTWGWGVGGGGWGWGVGVGGVGGGGGGGVQLGLRQ